MTTRQQRRRNNAKTARGPGREDATSRTLDMILNDPSHEVSITLPTLMDLRANGIPIKPQGDDVYRIGDNTNPVRVVDPRRLVATDHDCVVCRLWNDGPQEHLDNAKGICTRCFREVRHRPNIPVGFKLICVECLPGLLKH